VRARNGLCYKIVTHEATATVGIPRSGLVYTLVHSLRTSRPKIGSAAGYAISLLAVALAFLATYSTWPVLNQTPWALFFAAVMASAWFRTLFHSMVEAFCVIELRSTICTALAFQVPGCDACSALS
jgi:uncharacterized membrane protein